MNLFLKLLIILLSAIFVNCSRHKTNEVIPVLIISDFGSDVDDAEAITYLSECQNVNIAGIICCGYIPEIRAASLSTFMQLLDMPATIIAIGSALSLSVADSAIITKYLDNHLINNVPYEIALASFLDSLYKIKTDKHIENFNKITAEPLQLTDSLLDTYKNLRLVVLSQATDIAKYIKEKPEKAKRFHSIYIQGQASCYNNEDDYISLIPNYKAYNLSEDSTASEILFSLQNDVPFIIVGKYAAYQAAITKEEMNIIKHKFGFAGEYIEKAALSGLKSFAMRDFPTFKKIYNIETDNQENINIDSIVNSRTTISNPYDLLTVYAIKNIDIFNYITIGKHLLIGNDTDIMPIKNMTKFKNNFIFSDDEKLKIN